ncbi:low molecular weight protein-tyrosine-phosphatase [uncultured Martelella sp.]|uniref:low molecular weight protein-tyrosine-phosphatase n=1 Tax=uncultured Martelella sp. TaxID=392331 RepID=UPI0029C7DAB8|nr:low molecular weight protein-tyrosine-phosphatase [uncultured Martelella sp.]
MAQPDNHSVLFVCSGNICRSPLAEGVFTHLAQGAGRSRDFTVDSAGIGNWHEGELPDPRSRATAKRYGFDISGQRARQIRPADFSRFSLILGMDSANMAALKRLGGADPKAEVALFSDYTLGKKQDVPDPYYGGDDGFETVYHMLLAGCQSLLSRL